MAKKNYSTGEVEKNIKEEDRLRWGENEKKENNFFYQKRDLFFTEPVWHSFKKQNCVISASWHSWYRWYNIYIME